MFPVKRVKRKKNQFQENSPYLYYLKPAPKRRNIVTSKQIGTRLEVKGALHADDVVHSLTSSAREVREILASGDRVKIDGLGTFYLTFNCEGTEEEKDCTVKKIHKVNIRFIPDKSLKLINSANAATRSGNEVEFYIDNNITSSGSGQGSGGNNDENDDDPTA